MKTGSCLCGEVRYELHGDLDPPIACHCSQCRKTSGHYWAAFEIGRDRMRITRDGGLRWYRSSDKARRGFCRICGASVFWDPDGKDWIAVAAGTVDGDTGLGLSEHIFVANKGDYYELADGAVQKD